MVRALRTRVIPAQACANGHVECVQCLVDGGADVNAVDNNGMQPVDLAMASVTNREAVLEVLRAADATLRAAHATLSGADACVRRVHRRRVRRVHR